MALALYDGSDELFDVLGKLFYAAAAIDGGADSARTRLLAVVTAFEAAPNDLDTNLIIADVGRASTGFNSSASSAMGTIRTVGRNYLTQLVADDTSAPSVNFQAAVVELIDQMQTQSETVQANAVAYSKSEDADGDAVLIVSLKRGDGLKNEHCYAETITLRATDDAGRTVAVTGEASVDLLSPLWPLGSGATGSLTAITPETSRVIDGGFEDVSTNDANIPKGWILTTGTPGVTIGMTTNEEQTVTISGTPTSGYYLLQYTNAESKVQTTDQILYNASGNTVQTALRKLTGLSKVTVTTTGTTPNFTHTVKFVGVGGSVTALAAINQMDGGSPVNEVQRISLANTDGGTFTLTYAGQTTAAIDWDASAAEVDAALELLSNVGSGDLTCSGGPLPSTPISVTFGGSLAGTNVSEMTITTTNLTRSAATITVTEVTPGGVGATNEVQTITADGTPNGGTWTISWNGQTTSAIAAAATAYTVRDALCALSNIAGTDEVQTLTITGTPTGGTFTITYSGQTTAGIAYDANAATVQAALEALSNIGSGDVVCTGGALPGTPVVITFRQALGRQNVALMTASGAGLTGGTAPAAAVALTTQGVDSDVTVTGGPLGTAAFTVTFVNTLAAANQPAMTVGTGSLLGPDVTVSIATITSGSAAQDEVQAFQLYGTPTGGTFTLTFDGQTTSAIAYNASNATVLAALEALSNIAPGDVTMGGGTLPGSAVTVTFGGAYNETNVSELTIDGASLTGGSISASISTPTSGVSGLSTNLSAYWTMNEASGTRYDSEGGYDLTENNGIANASGKVGNAANIANSNEYFSRAHASALSRVSTINSGSITIAGWIYLHSTGSAKTIAAKADSGSANYSFSVGTDAKLSFSVTNNSGSTTTVSHGTALSTGTWYHVAATRDGGSGTINISLNGGTFASASATSTGGDGTSGQPFYVGGFAGSQYLDGRIDELGVWQRALSLAEIQDLYNSGSGTTYPLSGGVDEVQRITIAGSPSQGSFTLTFGGQTTVDIAYNASAATVQTALEALSSIGSGNVSCSGGSLPGTPVDVTFIEDLGATNVAAMTVNDNGLKTSVTTTTQGDPGTNEIQRLSASPVPVAGTFTLTYDGQTTSSLAYNASAADIQTALIALSNIGPSDVTCTGGPIDSANVLVNFAGTLAATNVAAITSTSSLTGASPTELTVATTTEGAPASNEVQRVTLGNSPEGGTFTLTHSAVTSGAIAYNASAAAVQAALNAMGIATFFVSGAAGGPWTIIFDGALAATSVSNFTYTSSLTRTAPSGTITTTTSGSAASGNITILETVAGTPQVYAGGRAMWFESDGSQLTTLSYKVSLVAATPYAVNLWACLDALDATGVIKIELVDGISGTVIQDDQGVANAITVNVNDLTTSYQALAALVTEPVFRTPTKMPTLVYLRIRFSTVPTSGTRVFFDHLAVTPMTELYAGGPFAALMAGASPLRIDDSFALTVTNDRAGDVHEWANRFFNLGGSRLLLPSVASSPTIPDSVIG